MLIDTSDPRRAATVSKSLGHATRLLESGANHHHFGLATFDSDLTLRAPLGSNVDDIVTATETITAVGKTTELYRNTLEAVQMLAAYPATRRILFLFSDGLAEDRAYFRQDVVRAATAGGVVIVSLGYSESVSLSVALQSLRRLAAETGGRFFAADRQMNLPEEVFQDSFAIADNGGQLEVELSDIEAPAGFGRPNEVRLELDTSSGLAIVAVPIALLPTPAPATETVIKVVEIEVCPRWSR